MSDTPRTIKPPPRCRDCHVALEIGFIFDESHGGQVKVSRWCAGLPQPGWFWSEVKSSQSFQGIKTYTYRCPKCFRLESFAPPPPDHE